MGNDQGVHVIYFCQGGATEVEMLNNEEDKIILRDAIDLYDNNFILK